MGKWEELTIARDPEEGIQVGEILGNRVASFYVWLEAERDRMLAKCPDRKFKIRSDTESGRVSLWEWCRAS